jgi:homotetrameric cytidine deaminase
VAAAALLDDGTWIPGVRVESASFSLTIPALLNAYTTAAAAGRASSVAAFVLSRPLRPEEVAYLRALPPGSGARIADDAWRVHPEFSGDALPAVADVLDPALGDAGFSSPEDGILRARRVAQRAHVPESSFPVGAVLDTGVGSVLPGVNVEHPDWGRILCAERSALGTAWSYGYTAPQHLYLSCPRDPQCTPCGACRQLLVELTPEMTLWMDRPSQGAASARPPDLLPGSFCGDVLLS